MKKLRMVVIAVLMMMATTILSGCMAKLPIPEIKEGCFDFSITYEINGEVKTYSNLYVCKFSGVLITLAGSSVEWEDYIKNEEEIGIPIQENDDGVIYISCGFFPEYFMGDPNAAYYDAPKPSLFMVYHSDDPDTFDTTSEEAVIAEYGVRLLDYEYAKPIENTFKEKVSLGRFEFSIN